MRKVLVGFLEMLKGNDSIDTKLGLETSKNARKILRFHYYREFMYTNTDTHRGTHKKTLDYNSNSKGFFREKHYYQQLF